MAISLVKPSSGSTNWGSDMNANLTTIEDTLNSGACKAWVVFDGTGAFPISVLAGHNVSSITDAHASYAGFYQVNLATSFASAHYAVVVSANIASGSYLADLYGTPTASSFSIVIIFPNVGFGNASRVTAACFGSQ